MANSDSVYAKLIEKVTENQIEISKISKENSKIIDSINNKLEDLNVKLSENSDLVGSTNHLLEDFQEVIKEFSIYATNREEHDKHLSSSMEVLANTWQESLAMFGETKEIIEKIYDFSTSVNDENLGILKRTEGKIISEISMLQERFVLGVVELYAKFTDGFTNQFILNRISDDFKMLSATDQKNMPQYLDFDQRHEWYCNHVDKYGDDLGITGFGKTLAKFFHIIYLCSIDGIDYSSSKYFGKYLSELGKFDKMIYQDYE